MKFEEKPTDSSVERYQLGYLCPKNPDALGPLIGCSRYLDNFFAIVGQKGYPEIANIVYDGGRVVPMVW